MCGLYGEGGGCWGGVGGSMGELEIRVLRWSINKGEDGGTVYV